MKTAIIANLKGENFRGNWNKTKIITVVDQMMHTVNKTEYQGRPNGEEYRALRIHPMDEPMKTRFDSGLPVKSPFAKEIIATSSLTITPGVNMINNKATYMVQKIAVEERACVRTGILNDA
jgi:hypothetical protein